jgi:hypothetical protein
MEKLVDNGNLSRAELSYGKEMNALEGGWHGGI